MKNLIARGKELGIRVERIAGDEIRFYNNYGEIMDTVSFIIAANVWLDGYEASENEISNIINKGASV